MAGEDHTVAAASVSEKDVLINQATVFDNINYMGRAVIGKFFLCEMSINIVDQTQYYIPYN